MTLKFAPISRRRCLSQLLACATLPAVLPALAAPALPADSVYQLDVPLTDQDGRVFRWPALRGAPQLVSMFYSSCDMVCPMIFETVQQTLQQLGRPDLHATLVSFDPARDTVARLKATAAEHGAQGPRWTLARSDDASTRALAAVLGVQYRRLASGEFNHSTVILLLDADGRIAARSGQLGRADPALLQAARRLPRA
jgi:protein SCO1/2